MAAIPYYALVNNGLCYQLQVARPDGSYDPPVRGFPLTKRGYEDGLKRCGELNATLPHNPVYERAH